MKSSILTNVSFFARLYLLTLFLSPFFVDAKALDEKFETYNSPQCLAMGKACTSWISGHAANFYNPAGVSALHRKAWELNVFALDGIYSTGGLSLATKGMSFGNYRLMGPLRESPGTYAYFNYSVYPSISFRGLTFGVLANYQFAGLSDGVNADIDTRQDIIPTLGIARHFAGNLLKLGFAVKAVMRNQMKGTFAHSELANYDDGSFPTLYKEGLGLGADIGVLMTLPMKYLPTIGVAWRDMFNTKFSSSRIINPKATGTPDEIPQSINAGFSVQPSLSRTFRAILSAEYSHIEDTARPWKKHIHLGAQFESEKSLIFWLGLNQLYPTFGIGLRVKGGNLEMGTYAEDIASNDEAEADRRFFFRYTITF